MKDRRLSVEEICEYLGIGRPFASDVYGNLKRMQWMTGLRPMIPEFRVQRFKVLGSRFMVSRHGGIQ